MTMDLYPTDSLDEATAVLTSNGSYYRETSDADTWERRADGALFTTEDLTNIIAINSSVLYRPAPDHAKFG